MTRFLHANRLPGIKSGRLSLEKRYSPSDPLELQPRQPRIESVGGNQLRVGALLDDPALIHHHDAVAGQDGRRGDAR